ncbi:MAG TPA: Tim44-like domain-containing protein [Solirubrobacteraceae bacterium]|nr:Tim44-like domain-containing protein [Solirubrobacteraceae bacterium]
MRRRRILVLAGALVLLGALLLPAAAFARAGGGTGSFGSGGGFGGGFSGGGSGKGFALYVAFRLVLDLILFGHGAGLLVVIVLAIGAYVYFFGARRVAEWWHAQRQRGTAARRATRRRERTVELAAAEAAEEDEAFTPERVRASAEKLFIDIQAAWSRGDSRRLHELVATRLMGEWERRLDDLARRGLTNHIELVRPPKVEYVGIGRGARATGPAGGPDRVVVRIEARIRDWVSDAHGREMNERGAATKTVRMREYWTLVRNPAAAATPAGDGLDASLAAEFDLGVRTATSAANEWMLDSIEQGAEGSHQLEARIVQTDWADTQALQDASLLEQAQADAAALPAGTQPGELTTAGIAFDQDARARALDLSLADGRFSPDILEIAARRAVAAWAQAIDGDQRALLALAGSDAVAQMLHPAGPASRLVIRGPQIERIAVVGLDALAIPATMAVDVKIHGRRYLQDRASTAILAGSDVHAVTFTERWTFTLSGDATNPWQVSSVASPSLSR